MARHRGREGEGPHGESRGGVSCSRSHDFWILRENSHVRIPFKCAAFRDIKNIRSLVLECEALAAKSGKGQQVVGAAAATGAPQPRPPRPIGLTSSSVPGASSSSGRRRKVRAPLALTSSRDPANTSTGSGARKRKAVVPKSTAATSVGPTESKEKKKKAVTVSAP